MSKYIDREALLEALGYDPAKKVDVMPGSTFDIILNHPVSDVAPVVRGRWENYPSDAYRRCTACKTEFEKARFSISANCCPNCGARMETEEPRR